MLPGLPKKMRSPGRRSPRSTAVPLEAENCASVTRGIWMPAFAYAHCASPEQSKPVCGVEPPQRYGLPLYFSASASAASARAPAPPPAPPRAAAAAAATGGRAPPPAGAGGGGGVAGGRRHRRRRGGRVSGVPEQAVGLAEAQRVTAAVLLGR